MMTRMVRTYVVVAFLVILGAPTYAEDKSWLIGDWLLTYDPDGDTQDRITFTEDDGFITTEVSTGRQHKGIYLLKPGVITVHLFSQGRTFMKFDLQYDEKRDKLYFKGSTGSVSHYTKIN